MSTELPIVFSESFLENLQETSNRNRKTKRKRKRKIAKFHEMLERINVFGKGRKKRRYYRSVEKKFIRHSKSRSAQRSQSFTKLSDMLDLKAVCNGDYNDAKMTIEFPDDPDLEYIPDGGCRGYPGTSFHPPEHDPKLSSQELRQRKQTSKAQRKLLEKAEKKEEKKEKKAWERELKEIKRADKKKRKERKKVEKSDRRVAKALEKSLQKEVEEKHLQKNTDVLMRMCNVDGLNISETTEDYEERMNDVLSEDMEETEERVEGLLTGYMEETEERAEGLLTGSMEANEESTEGLLTGYMEETEKRAEGLLTDYMEGNEERVEGLLTGYIDERDIETKEEKKTKKKPRQYQKHQKEKMDKEDKKLVKLEENLKAIQNRNAEKERKKKQKEEENLKAIQNRNAEKERKRKQKEDEKREKEEMKARQKQIDERKQRDHDIEKDKRYFEKTLKEQARAAAALERLQEKALIRRLKKQEKQQIKEEKRRDKQEKIARLGRKQQKIETKKERKEEKKLKKEGKKRAKWLKKEVKKAKIEQEQLEYELQQSGEIPNHRCRNTCDRRNNRTCHYQYRIGEPSYFAENFTGLPMEIGQGDRPTLTVEISERMHRRGELERTRSDENLRGTTEREEITDQPNARESETEVNVLNVRQSESEIEVQLSKLTVDESVPEKLNAEAACETENEAEDECSCESIDFEPKELHLELSHIEISEEEQIPMLLQEMFQEQREHQHPLTLIDALVASHGSTEHSRTPAVRKEPTLRQSLILYNIPQRHIGRDLPLDLEFNETIIQEVLQVVSQDTAVNWGDCHRLAWLFHELYDFEWF